MAAREGDYRVFIGGLSWDVTERDLEDAFRRYGKILDCQIMMERDTGRPRGFGFLTFGDRRGMEDAIREMHGRTFGDRAISVNRAQPKPGEDSPSQGYGGGYSSLSRGSYRGSDRLERSDRIERTDECFKCGRPGHWARDCPSAGGGGGRGLNAPLSSRSRYGDVGGRGDRLALRDRYIEDRYDGGRYGDKDRIDSRDKYGAQDRIDSRAKYGAQDRIDSRGARNEYFTDRYAPPATAAAGDRYRGPGRLAPNGYDKDRGGYDRDVVAPRRGTDKYGGGPIRSAGRGYAERAAPYDRPGRGGGRPSSFDRY